MPNEYIILIIGYIFGFYMAWNIGANDVANSMASAVGAKAITIRQAVFIAGTLNVLGATFIGSHVTNTIRKGIVSTEVLTDPHLALIGALSAPAGRCLVGIVRHLEIPASLHNPFHRGGHDRIRPYGRRHEGHQLVKAGSSSHELDYLPGFQHGNRLYPL